MHETGSKGKNVNSTDILYILAVVIFSILAAFIAHKFRARPHKILIRLIAANIVLDLLAIAIWAIPQAQWNIYRLGVLIVGTEAAVAAGLFALALFGLIKRKKWAPPLAIALPLAQRIFGTYVFFPSTGIGLTTIWSLLIIYFAYKDANYPEVKTT